MPRKRLFVAEESGEEIFLSDDADENYELSDESVSSEEMVSKTTKKKIGRKKNQLVPPTRVNKRPRTDKNQSKLKKNKKNHNDDDQTDRTSVRSRTKNNRYGSRESTVNFDDFFDKLASQQKQRTTQGSSKTSDCIDAARAYSALDDDEPLLGQNEASNSTNSVVNDHLNEQMSSCRDEIKMMQAKIDAQFAVMTKQCARIEALLKYHKKPIGGGATVSNSVDQSEFLEEDDWCETQLKEMGLPATQVQHLIQIEKKLNDTGFEAAMVFKFFYYVYMHAIQQ